jgi:hypothetical protein
MQPGGSLLNSQGPTTTLCPEPEQFNPWVHPGSWRIVVILSSHLCLRLPNCLIPSDFLAKTLYAPFCHTCYTPYPSPRTWFHHPNNNWWGAQIIMLLHTIRYAKLRLVSAFSKFSVFISGDLHIRITSGGNKTQSSCAIQRPDASLLWVTSLSLLPVGSV